jgi:hypothetical protein
VQACDIDPRLIELFVDGEEDSLPGAWRLDGLGLGEGSVVFMLQRAGWRWTPCAGIALSGQGLVASRPAIAAATKTIDYGWQLVTGGLPMTEGRHYWEVELTGGSPFVMIGAARPGMKDHDENHNCSSNACDFFSVHSVDGALRGNGKSCAYAQGMFAEGDRIGVLLDLDAGWLRFYRNSKRCGPGFTKGVTGPLVRAVHIAGISNKVTVLPAAVAPEGAGGAHEPWVVY